MMSIGTAKKDLMFQDARRMFTGEIHMRANSKPANKPLTRRGMLCGLCAFGLPTELLAQTAPGSLSREQFCAMELIRDLAIQRANLLLSGLERL